MLSTVSRERGVSRRGWMSWAPGLAPAPCCGRGNPSPRTQIVFTHLMEEDVISWLDTHWVASVIGVGQSNSLVHFSSVVT